MLWMLVRHCARHKRSCLQISNFGKSMTQISLSGAPWSMDLKGFWIKNAVSPGSGGVERTTAAKIT